MRRKIFKWKKLFKSGKYSVLKTVFVAFCSFFRVGALLYIELDYKKVEVDNEKAIKLDNSNVF